MKKILVLVLLSLYYSGFVWGSNFKNDLKEAEQGNVPRQWYVGNAYHYGNGVPQDYKKAFFWFKKAADRGFVQAQSDLGTIYYHGRGVPQNYKQSILWYTKAAEQGYAAAQLILGDMYDKGQGIMEDDKQAVYWFKQAAKQGFAAAQYRLGWLHNLGIKGVSRDIKQAMYWYIKAAEKGHPGAQYNLGWLYDTDNQERRDYKQAVYWFTKAAEKGHPDAQFCLGNMYYEGRGVSQNYRFAYIWETLAAAQGHGKAKKNRDILKEKLSPQQLGEAQELAAKIQYKIDHPSKSQEHQSSISETEKKVTGSGTGFVITKDGYILTCYHVIKNANEIKITIGGNIYPAKLIRDDPNNDLALLKINGSFPAIAFSPKRSAKMGQEVFTIGYPNPSLQGVSAKFTKGTINSLTGFQDDLRLYQVSVPVQPGNSGGALLDENGNVLGVIMAMLDAKTTFNISGSLPQNVNYAVKSIYAQAMLDTFPAIADKLIAPSKNNTNVVERVNKCTVMILTYK